MRISDWSSDVCSSDLLSPWNSGSDRFVTAGRSSSSDRCGELIPVFSGRTTERAWSGTLYKAGDIYLQVPGGHVRMRSRRKEDRRSVGSGRCVSVGVDTGGVGIVKKTIKRIHEI